MSGESYLGEIRLFAFQTIPQGWLPCDGQTLETREYHALYSLIGGTFGGDARRFKLPDLRGRAILAASEEHPQGKAAGSEAETLGVNHLPPHTHTLRASTDTKSGEAIVGPAGNFLGVAQPSSQGTQPINIYTQKSTANVALSDETIGRAGGNAAHENRQPYLAMTYCICVLGAYPPRAD